MFSIENPCKRFVPSEWKADGECPRLNMKVCGAAQAYYLLFWMQSVCKLALATHHDRLRSATGLSYERNPSRARDSAQQNPTEPNGTNGTQRNLTGGSAQPEPNGRLSRTPLSPGTQ